MRVSRLSRRLLSCLDSSYPGIFSVLNGPTETVAFRSPSSLHISTDFRRRQLSTGSSGAPPLRSWSVFHQLRVYSQYSAWDVKDLLNIPLGKYTAEKWREAKEKMRAMYERGAAQDVNASFDLLEQLVREYDESGNGDWILNSKLLSRLVKNWQVCARRKDENVMSPVELGKRLEQLSNECPDFQYNIYTFTMILDTAVRQQPSRKAPAIAEELLDYAQKLADKGKTELTPNVVTWGVVLNVWAKSGLDEAPTRVEGLLEGMRARGIQPNAFSYSTVLNLYGSVGDSRRAAELLECIIHDYCSGASSVAPNVQLCNMVLSAHARSTDKESAKHADRLLDRIIRGDIPGVQPNVVSFTTVMDAYANVGDGYRAQVVMEKMHESHVEPNTISYNTLKKAWGSAGEPEKAEAVLFDMMASSNVKPNVRTFTTVMEAWAESSHHEAFERAEKVLELMQKSGIQPDAFSFSTLLKLIAKSNQKDAGEKAEEILHTMESLYRAGNDGAKPDKVTYNSAIKACLQAGDQDRAQALLRRMEASGVKPNVRTFSEILNAWAKLSTTSSAWKCEEVLGMMLRLAKSNPAAKPNIVSYNTAIKAWARSGDPSAWKHVLRIYERLQTGKYGVKPDLSTFSTVLLCLARSGRREAIEKADQILCRMENDGVFDADKLLIWYGSVVNAWIGEGDLDRAENLVVRMLEVWLNRDTGPKAARSLFERIKDAWLKVGDVDRADAVYHKMQEMQEIQSRRGKAAARKC